MKKFGFFLLAVAAFTLMAQEPSQLSFQEKKDWRALLEKSYALYDATQLEIIKTNKQIEKSEAMRLKATEMRTKVGNKLKELQKKHSAENCDISAIETFVNCRPPGSVQKVDPKQK